MKKSAFRRMLALFLCLLMCLGCMPSGAFAEEGEAESTGLSAEERQAVLGRYMGTWVFPLPEEYYGGVADFGGCRGGSEDALYGRTNGACISGSHGDTDHGNVGLDIRVNPNVEIYAPIDGTLFRSGYADGMGYVVIIEQKAGEGYSYYVIFRDVSDAAPVGSGYSVSAGSVAAYTYGPTLHFGAVMAPSGKGEAIAANPSGELKAIWKEGWLTGTYGTGIICINPSSSTYSAYGNSVTASLYGPVTYRFVQPEPETQPHTEHTWDGGTVVVAPTHTAPGQVIYTCTVCGETWESTVDAVADHTYDQTVPSDTYLASAATCQSAALYYYSCICGEKGSDVFAYGEAGSHAWDGGYVAVEATHTAPGQMVYTCSSCGTTRTEELAAQADHSFTQAIVAPEFLKSGATCTSPAVYYMSCICGQIGTETFTDGAAGDHTWDQGVITVQPSHTADGVMTYTCTTCGTTRTETLSASADHVFDQQNTGDAYLISAANCQSGAVYVYSCICGEKGSATFTVGAPTDHIWDQGTVTVQPSHTAAGSVTYTCTVCGTTRTETVQASADHIFDQKNTADTYLIAEANCQSGVVYIYSCICGEKGNDIFTVGDPSDHVWDQGVFTVQPTHTTTGEKTYTCSVCGQTRKELVSASADHVFDQQVAAVDYLKSNATCTEAAVYYMSCVCGLKGEATFTSGTALGHSYSTEWSKNETHHWHAATCAHTGEVGSFAEHTWDAGTVTVQATHTTNGEKTYTCTACGQTKKETVPATTEHVFDQKVVADKYFRSAATCEEAARYYKSCICGEKGTKSFHSGDPLGHRFSDQWQKNDTQHWHAAICEHTGEVSDLANHTWDAGRVTTQPGHAVDGESTYTCTACGATKTEVVPGNAHVYDMRVVDAKFLKTPATCTTAPVYYLSCQCGAAGTDTFVAGEPTGHTFSNEWSKNETQHWLAATCEHTNEKVKLGDHIWDPGVITVQPTSTSKGQKTFTCTTCGATKTAELEPTAHTHTYAEAWSMNENAHWHAATCEHTSEASGFALHTWNGGVQTVAPTHTTNGEIVYTCTTCGQTKRETIQAVHTFDQMIAGSAFVKSYASCNTAAEYYFSCVCGAKGTSSFLSGNPLGHSYSSTWSTDENYHWHACVICNTKGEIQTHSYDANTNTCTVCGYTKKDAHVHTSHLTRVPAKSPTCTEDGAIAYYTCECGLWFSDVTATSVITDPNSVVVSAVGHVDKDKNGKCDVCKEQIAQANVEYKITEGNESTWINNSSQGVVFRSDSDYSKFDHVEVDGATVSSLNYTVSSGSTIVELNANYLKRLTIGRHTISIVSTDGKASASFNIKQATAATTTKDEGGSSLWIVVAVIALLALIAAGAIVGYLFYTGRLGGSKGGKFSR